MRGLPGNRSSTQSQRELRVKDIEREFSLHDVRMVEGTEEADLAQRGLRETLIVVAAGDADLQAQSRTREEGQKRSREFELEIVSLCLHAAGTPVLTFLMATVWPDSRSRPL